MRLMVMLLPLLWMTPTVPDRVVLPALPHPPPQPNALPAVRDGVALEQLVEEGRKLWFEDAPAGAEPFGVPTVPHGLTGVPGWNATHDGVLSVLNFVRPTGLIPHGGGMPVGMVDGDTMAQTCSACHTDAPNGTPIPGLANRHYSQKAMFRLGRMSSYGLAFPSPFGRCPRPRTFCKRGCALLLQRRALNCDLRRL